MNKRCGRCRALAAARPVPTSGRWRGVKAVVRFPTPTRLGAALAAGRQCFVVSPYEWSIANHPNCRAFPILADAVEAILARDQPAGSWRQRNEAAVVRPL
jgi:hypothetical protein